VQAEHQYKFDVKMTCGGCSGAVSRVLAKAEGAFAFLLA
jgi:copper chaperone